MGKVQRWMRERVAEGFGEDCLLWPFSRNKQGAAYAWNPRRKMVEGAYRVMWEIENDRPFPDGLEARHTCHHGDDGCVNLRHIVPGTREENSHDLWHGAPDRVARASGFALAKLTEDDVRAICERLVAGDRCRDVAAAFGVSAKEVSGIWTGEKWPHVGCPRRDDVTRFCDECGGPIPKGKRQGTLYCGTPCANLVMNRRFRARHQ